MAKVRITQTRSTIKRPETQLRTIQSLGLGKYTVLLKWNILRRFRAWLKK
jgi:hypothetical protein